MHGPKTRAFSFKMHKFIFFIIFLFPINSFADTYWLSDPTESEKLSQPIPLSCGEAIIDEWKADSHYPVMTNISQAGINQLDLDCQLAINYYGDFLKSKNLEYKKDKIKFKISLLPANELLDGARPRNLADVKGRMRYADPVCCDWGLWHDPSKRLFLRNDPIYLQNGKILPNKYWRRTFLHEMAHILNFFWHVKEKYNMSNETNEQLAEEWVNYLGFDFKTESASKDLENKRKN